MKYDSISFGTDTAIGIMGTGAAATLHELAALIVVLTNFAYIVFRLVRHFKDGKNDNLK